MCIDYKQINQVTIKNKYPLPRIDELFDQLQGVVYFSEIYLRSGYHQLRVYERDFQKQLAFFGYMIRISPVEGLGQVAFFGHIITRDGLRVDSAKVEAVINWHSLKTVAEIRSFLGLVGSYRRFVNDF